MVQLDLPYMISCMCFLRGTSLKNLTDLDVDLSESLILKSERAVGLTIHDFLYSSISPTLTPLRDIVLHSLRDNDFLTFKVTQCQIL